MRAEATIELIAARRQVFVGHTFVGHTFVGRAASCAARALTLLLTVALVSVTSVGSANAQQPPPEVQTKPTEETGSQTQEGAEPGAAMAGTNDGAAEPVGSREDEPPSLEDRLLATRALIGTGNQEQAKKAVEGMFRADENSGLAWVAKAELHFSLAEYGEGGQAAYKAVQQDPSSAEAHLLLAEVFESERRMLAARKHYRAAYQLSPSSSSTILPWMYATPNAKEARELREQYLAILAEEETPGAAARTSWIELEGRLLETGGVCRRTEQTTEKIDLRVVRDGPSQGSSFGVKLSFNGSKNVVAKIDTGATGFLVPRRVATKAKIEVVGTTRVLGLGKEGIRDGELGLARSLRIGGVEFKNCPVRIVEDVVFEHSDTGALIGLDALYADSVVTLDFGKPEIRLQPHQALPLNKEAKPDRYGYDRDPTTFAPDFHPVRILGGDFLLPTVLRGKGDRATSAYFIIDTGAETLLLGKRAAAKVSTLHWTRRRAKGISGEILDLQQTEPIVVEVLGFAQRYQSPTAIDLSAYSRRNGFDGLLGHLFLEHTVLTLDDRLGAVRLELGEVRRRPKRRRTVL